MLPKKIIAGLSVRDYAYQWIDGGCLLHQWASGGRGIDADVLAFARSTLADITAAAATAEGQARTGWVRADVVSFGVLVAYLAANLGAPAETYVPDQWTRRGRVA